MGIFYVDKRVPERGGYEIFKDAEGFRWRWSETAKGVFYEDFGRWLPSMEAAYLDAAADWENNGGWLDKRLQGQLKSAAARAAKAVR
jgi:hypothetical protein